MASSQFTFDELTGTVIPDTADTLTQVQNEFKAAFGSDLIVDPATPQGLLISAETLARNGVLQLTAALANQINPNLSGGVFFDAIWALTGGQRTAALYSVIQSVDLTGVPGTVIPEGSTAKLSTNGEIFASTGSVTLDVSGNASVNFQAVNSGPIAANSGTLTDIVNGVLGWETVNNTNAAIPGATTQSDESAHFYRNQTLALQGQSLPEAITSALMNIPGVTSLTFLENISPSTQTISGITMVGHSIYVCVAGGTDLEIAAALTQKKSAGAAYNGSVTVPYVVPISGQTIDVKFDRPTNVTVLAKVYVKANNAISDLTAAVQTAIVDYAAGLIQGQPGFVVGAPVSPFELSGAINSEVPGIFVTNVEVAYALSPSFAPVELAIAINEQASISSGGILVIIV